MFDDDLEVPKCKGLVQKCTTVGSNGGVSGNDNVELLTWKNVTVNPPQYPYSEPNGPNTVDGCADGQSGDFLQAEAVNAITVEATDGGYLKRGESVNITANVYAYDTAARYDFYLSGNPITQIGISSLLEDPMDLFFHLAGKIM